MSRSDIIFILSINLIIGSFLYMKKKDHMHIWPGTCIMKENIANRDFMFHCVNSRKTI